MTVFCRFLPIENSILPVALSDIKFDAVYRILEGLVLVFFIFSNPLYSSVGVGNWHQVLLGVIMYRIFMKIEQ